MVQGHVYIVRADLRRLACDAWLMPCGIEARPLPHWLLPGWKVSGWPAPPHDWDEERLRVLKVHGWATSLPQPYLVNVGQYAAPASWYVEGARQFLETVASEVCRRPSLFGRVMPLVGLPLVGAGYGGGQDRAGEIVQ